MSGVIPEGEYRPYPASFTWFFAAACSALVAAVLTQ
jgi:hypothetical protein